ncbi:MAG TPA: ABC transporter permease subunit [Dehalococcoidia bacterium]|jgi:ABC-2 type transport system permease protein
MAAGGQVTARHAARGGIPALVIFQASLRALLTGRRWIVVVLLDAIFVLLALLLATQSDSATHQRHLVELYHNLGLPALLPFVALLFSTEALGAEVEDRTLIYLTLRPLPSAAIVVAKFAAAFAITLAATWVPLIASFLLLGLQNPPSGQLPALLLSSAIGSAGYCAVFLLLGLLLRRALLIGAIYVLTWEGAIAALSTSAAHLSVRFYTFGVYAGMLRHDEYLNGDPYPAPVGAFLFLVLVVLAALWWTARRLRRTELK